MSQLWKSETSGVERAIINPAPLLADTEAVSINSSVPTSEYLDCDSDMSTESSVDEKNAHAKCSLMEDERFYFRDENVKFVVRHYFR